MLPRINGPTAIQNEPQGVHENPIADTGTAGYSPIFASLTNDALKSAMGRPPKSDVKSLGIVFYDHSARNPWMNPWCSAPVRSTGSMMTWTKENGLSPAWSCVSHR